MKRGFCLLSMLLMVFSAYGQNAGDFMFEVHESSKTITITGYTGTSDSVSIPENINGLPVTELAYSLFMNNETIVSVVLPAALVEIGDFAFYGCVNLVSVVLPSTLKEIGSHAFHGCANLKNLDIPPFVSVIAWSAFYGCDNLPQSVVEKIKAIGGDMALYYPGK